MKLIQTAKTLLLEGKVDVIVGLARSEQGLMKPTFAFKTEQAEILEYDPHACMNLSVYLTRADLRSMGKIGLLANAYSLRSLLRLAAENQIKEDGVLAIVVEENQETMVLDTFKRMEDYVRAHMCLLTAEDKLLIDKIEAMSISDRWKFWQNEFKKCTKCYACRQACPLCYCTQCVADQNQPQWVSSSITPLGVTEWHMVRAMHLAGRCTACGQCAKACPVGIPLHLLPIRIGQEIESVYGSVAGTDAHETNVLSSFKNEDKENFIG